MNFILSYLNSFAILFNCIAVRLTFMALKTNFANPVITFSFSFKINTYFEVFVRDYQDQSVCHCFNFIGRVGNAILPAFNILDVQYYPFNNIIIIIIIIIIIRLTCQFHLKWVARLLCLFRVSFSTPFCLRDLPLIASSV